MRSKAVNGTGNKLQEKIYIEQKFTDFLFQGLQAMFIQVQVQELIKQNTYSFTKRENNKIIVKFWRKKLLLINLLQ